MAVEQQKRLIEVVSYDPNYGMSFRRYFQKGGHQCTHQAHVFEIGSPEIERHLKFRDWMRTNSMFKKSPTAYVT